MFIYKSLYKYLEVENKYFSISTIINCWNLKKKWFQICFDLKCSQKGNQKLATELVKEY